jgi:hypothetical protein
MLSMGRNSAMDEAMAAIVAALRDQPAPVGGWSMPDLRRVAGVSVGSFAAAIMQLRRDGKVHPYDLALARSMWPVEAVAEPVPDLAEAVAAEAMAAGVKRQAARSIGVRRPIDAPSIGAQLQEKALDGAPLLAAGIVRDRWSATWDRLCRHAERSGQRPVVAMIALLDGALDGEIRP